MTGVTIHRDHVILDLRLHAIRTGLVVDLLEGDELLLVKRGKVVRSRGAKITAGALDPKHLDFFARERIGLAGLGRSVSSSGIGDALVRP
jgi:hypothetical protein